MNKRKFDNQAGDTARIDRTDALQVAIWRAQATGRRQKVWQWAAPGASRIWPDGIWAIQDTDRLETPRQDIPVQP